MSDCQDGANFGERNEEKENREESQEYVVLLAGAKPAERNIEGKWSVSSDMLQVIIY